MSAYTKGHGQLSCIPAGYAPCHNSEEIIAAAGYDADSDLENTADSVFCSHGAGVVVRWDKVPSRMHIPSVLARGSAWPGPPRRRPPLPAGQLGIPGGGVPLYGGPR